MTPFDPAKYGSLAMPLLGPRLPELGPGSPNQAAHASLSALTPEIIFPQLGDHSMALCCISGLWLLHDFLDESHRISQDISTSTGSYWHGIMHRREPDAANSKYWFRQMGHHPIVEMLATEAPAIGYAYRTPSEFVDFCERVRGAGSAEEDLAKRVQCLEWELLFAWCFERAVGT